MTLLVVALGAGAVVLARSFPRAGLGMFCAVGFLGNVLRANPFLDPRQGLPSLVQALRQGADGVAAPFVAAVLTVTALLARRSRLTPPRRP